MLECRVYDPAHRYRWFSANPFRWGQTDPRGVPVTVSLLLLSSSASFPQSQVDPRGVPTAVMLTTTT